MGLLRKKLLFIGLSFSAYTSPMLMIFSLFTNYWLSSLERLQTSNAIKDKTRTTVSTTTITESITAIVANTIVTTNYPKLSKNSTIPVISTLDYIKAVYGLWEMCKIIDTSGIEKCESIKHFQGFADSEVRLTDSLKRQIGVCIIPILTALFLMGTSVILHTYACLKNKLPHLFLISGCIFIFAGLASLTGLIVFIAAVNGAIDSQLTQSKLKDDEPPFTYRYEISFFCAIFSFLMQEFNGICNIYWYINHFRRHKFESFNIKRNNESLLENVKNGKKKVSILKKYVKESIEPETNLNLLTQPGMAPPLPTTMPIALPSLIRPSTILKNNTQNIEYINTNQSNQPNQIGFSLLSELNINTLNKNTDSVTNSAFSHNYKNDSQTDTANNLNMKSSDIASELEKNDFVNSNTKDNNYCNNISENSNSIKLIKNNLPIKFMPLTYSNILKDQKSIKLMSPNSSFQPAKCKLPSKKLFSSYSMAELSSSSSNSISPGNSISSNYSNENKNVINKIKSDLDVFAVPKLEIDKFVEPNIFTNKKLKRELDEYDLKSKFFKINLEEENILNKKKYHGHNHHHRHHFIHHHHISNHKRNYKNSKSCKFFSNSFDDYCNRNLQQKEYYHHHFLNYPCQKNFDTSLPTIQNNISPLACYEQYQNKLTDLNNSKKNQNILKDNINNHDLTILSLQKNKTNNFNTKNKMQNNLGYPLHRDGFKNNDYSEQTTAMQIQNLKNEKFDSIPSKEIFNQSNNNSINTSIIPVIFDNQKFTICKPNLSLNEALLNSAKLESSAALPLSKSKLKVNNIPISILKQKNSNQIKNSETCIELTNNNRSENNAKLNNPILSNSKYVKHKSKIYKPKFQRNKSAAPDYNPITKYHINDQEENFYNNEQIENHFYGNNIKSGLIIDKTNNVRYSKKNCAQLLKSNLRRTTSV